MEISLDNFLVDIVVIMGYNKKNRAVFLDKNGKKKKNQLLLFRRRIQKVSS